MNKILVSRDKIISDSKNVLVLGNEIRLLDSETYFIEYMDIEEITLTISVLNGVKAVLFECSSLMDIEVNNRYVIGNGELRVNKFYNNNSVNEKIDILLCREDSKIDYCFSNICKKREDYVININHLARCTVSNINNKSVAMDGSEINFIINSRVLKEYEKSVLNQNTRIVTLGDSRAKISPNMYIENEDVDARHGSVIGTFKDEIVFYLMSRGIEYDDVIKLLIKGYLLDNIDVDNSLRERIFNTIDNYWR